MSLVPSAYSPSGFELVDDRIDRPDPTTEQRAAARRADRIGYRQLLTERKWSAAQFDTARLYGFPNPVGQVLGRDGSSSAVYSRTAVDEWAAKLKLFVKSSLR